MLHPDATTVRLIHRHMIAEEMRRHRRLDTEAPERPTPRSQPTIAIRRATARILRAIARRIEPRPRAGQPLPPAKPAT